MRALIWGFGLFALAVVLTLVAHYNSGYVLIAVPTHRIEISLNLAVLLVALACIAFHLIVRTAQIVLALPEKARAFRQEQRRQQSARSLDEALNAYFESRYGRAELAAKNARDPQHRALGTIVSARAAHELRNFQGRDDYLSALENDAADRPYLRLMTQAELLLDERRYHDALSTLSRLPEKHSAALKLELRAQQLARNWDQALALLPQLEKRRVFEPGVLNKLRQHCHREMLHGKTGDPHALREHWQRVGAEDRLDAQVAGEAARAFLAGGAKDEASGVIEASLTRQWDAALIELYPECVATDARRQLERAESWIETRPKDAALLLALGRICVRASLWGKARSYLEAALAIESSAATHLEYGRLLQHFGESGAATQQLEKALELALPAHHTMSD